MRQLLILDVLIISSITTISVFTETENETKLYYEVLNPRQIEYDEIKGFNDLHIEAIIHIDPNSAEKYQDLDIIVHHHCKVYNDMTATCLLFLTDMTDQDRPYGIEYIIFAKQYESLLRKKYWHYHLTEFSRAKTTFPDLTE